MNPPTLFEKRGGVYLTLSRNQIDALDNQQQQVEDSFSQGKPGIILAQVRPDQRSAEVLFIEHETAKKIIRLLSKNKKGGPL